MSPVAVAVANALLASVMAFSPEHGSDHQLDELLQTSSGANVEAPGSILGMVRLVEVRRKPGIRACSPLETPAVEPGA